MCKSKSGRKRDKFGRNIQEPSQNSLHFYFKSFLAKIWSFLQLYVLAIKWELIELFTRHYNFKENEKQPHPGDVVVITGGGKGIGAEVVKMMLQCHKHVIIGCRNPAAVIKYIRKLRTENITSGSAECLYLDLASLTSVREFAHKILSKNTPINVLINNAGVMFVPFNLTEDGFEYHFQVNYLSHFLLTNLLLPKMASSSLQNRKSEVRCARIVNVSSCVHYGGHVDFSDVQLFQNYSPHKAYMNSKLMQVVASNYLDKKLRREGLNVRSLSVHPAISCTDLYENVPWFRASRPFVKAFMRTAKQGADGVAYAALSPRLENQGGVFLANSKKWRPNMEARSAEIQHNLWKKTCEYANLKDNGTMYVH